MRARAIVSATCHGLNVLIILSSIATCAGHVFLPLSKVNVTIPTSAKALKLLTKVPLGKFQVSSLDPNVNASDYTYKLDSDRGYLQINGRTGEVFVGSNIRDLGDKSSSFVLTARNSKHTNTSITTHMTIEIQPDGGQNFCTKLEKLCFWDSVSYAVTEDNELSNDEHKKIGELGPYSFKHLCPQYDISYKLNNSSEYLMIINNTLYTRKKLDHDSFNPGPLIVARVVCTVKGSPNAIPQDIEKIFNISVLDLNDNSPVLQDKEEEIFKFNLDDPHVTKGQLIGKKILFLDQDSLPVNAHMTYEIHNDTLEILKPECNGYDTDHMMGLKSSAISCQLLFARSGIIRNSPYCMTLEAIDTSVIYGDPKSAKANICINTDVEKIHEIDRPTAMALQSAPHNSKRGRNGREQKHSRRLFVSSSEEALSSNESGAGKNSKPVPIVYPKDVYVYRTATNLSRVTQPERMKDLMNRPSIKFNITEDPTGAFGITEIGGILYIKNLTGLKTAPETIYYITVSWKSSSMNIIMHLEDGRPPNTTTCEELDDIAPSTSCSRVGTKRDCNNLCAHGTNGGNCQWRSTNESGLVVNYSTCSPDLTFCPDNICDPLEDLGEKLDIFLCPQDCSPSSKIFGAHTTKNNRGIYAAAGICTCDHFGKCSCAAHSTSSKLKKSSRGSEKKSNQNSTVSPGPYLSANYASFECGPSCLMLVIGCSSVLIIIVIGLVISRRKYVQKAKRKCLADKNDGDNRNADLPLVSMENDLKFDIHSDTKWEFPKKQLRLDITLGEGEFGKVVKGHATNIDDRPGVTTVAVKMLKSGSNSVEHLALLSEFQLLQEVSHPNVIRLLGACTKGESPLLIIEYACYGSLRSYLRLSRKIECSGIEFTNGVEAVTVKDILSFAWQICKGMAYLTEIKLVHRDLAARNVLLAEGKICKISDFGLTRDVYEDDAYLKRSKDRVPVKWMAPESLADHVYTTKSDVWAFGVLVWELITLGSSPYPGVPPQNLYHLLKTGYRMERPENCSEEIYSIVRKCWTEDPSSRPSFKYLASQWEKLLGNNAQYLELEANAVSNPIYCQDEDKESQPDATATTKMNNFGEPDCLDHLWRAPAMSYDTPDQSHDHDFDNNHSRIPPGYDMPRPLIEAKTTEQNLRYENDIRFPLNIKLSARASQLLDPNHYSIPVKRGKSYMDMTNRTLISDNLDNEDIEKKLSKNISFRFSSLLNLNEQVTSVV